MNIIEEMKAALIELKEINQKLECTAGVSAEVRCEVLHKTNSTLISQHLKLLETIEYLGYQLSLMHG
jgi:hypothetical protein